MARNGTFAVLLALAATALADEGVVERWDNPKRESFEMKGAWPEKVVEELRARYGVPFECKVAGIERKDFLAKDVTFFEALDRFAALHGLSVVGVPLPEEKREFGQPGLALARPEPALPPTPVAYLGPSRLSVQAVVVRATARCAAETPPDADVPEEVWREMDPEADDEPLLRLRVRWIAEPGYEDARIVAWTVKTAADDAGSPLKLLEPPELPVRANRDFFVDFERPARTAKRIGKVDGHVRVVLPVKAERVEFLAGDAGTTKALGGARITFDGADAGKPAVRFTVKGLCCEAMDPGDHGLHVRVGEERHWGFGDDGGLTLLPYDAEGRDIGSGGYSSTEHDGRKWTFEIGLEQAPARLAFEAVTQAAEREASFAFANLPLPE